MIQTKQNDRCKQFCFATISEVEILKIEVAAVPENTKKTKYQKVLLRPLSEYYTDNIKNNNCF